MSVLAGFQPSKFKSKENFFRFSQFLFNHKKKFGVKTPSTSSYLLSTSVLSPNHLFLKSTYSDLRYHLNGYFLLIKSEIDSLTWLQRFSYLRRENNFTYTLNLRSKIVELMHFTLRQLSCHFYRIVLNTELFLFFFYFLLIKLTFFFLNKVLSKSKVRTRNSMYFFFNAYVTNKWCKFLA